MVSKVNRVLLLVFICLLLTAPVYATPENASVQSSCGDANVQISEVNYVTESGNEAEFIELRADQSTLLTGLEIHLIGADGIYQKYALKGLETSDLGYFILKGSGHIPLVDIVDDNTFTSVDERNLIDDGSPGGIGLFDKTEGQYCNFINYGGAVDGHEDYLNIGLDSAADGKDRSCARMSWGWWTCSHIATPATSNETVSVGMSTHAAVVAYLPALTAVVAMMMLLLTVMVRRQRQPVRSLTRH